MVIEAGAPGWVEMLHHAGAVVHVVDPKKAKAFASSVCSSGAKDDRRDGAMLAEMGRSSHLRLDVWTPDSDLGEQLGELSAMHETLTKDLTAAQQRLRGHLRERMPALEAVLGDLTRRWVHRLLRAVPTAWHAQKMTEEGFATLMRGSGARTISLAEVAQALHACTAPWLTEAVAGAQATRVTMLVEQIELLVRQLGDYDNDRYVAALKANGVAWAAELERTAA